MAEREERKEAYSGRQEVESESPPSAMRIEVVPMSTKPPKGKQFLSFAGPIPFQAGQRISVLEEGIIPDGWELTRKFGVRVKESERYEGFEARMPSYPDTVYGTGPTLEDALMEVGEVLIDLREELKEAGFRERIAGTPEKRLYAYIDSLLRPSTASS